MIQRQSRRRTATSAPIPEGPSRLYTVCVFDEELAAPWVQLIDARDDDEAVALGRAVHPSKRREIWDRHRLVAELPYAP